MFRTRLIVGTVLIAVLVGLSWLDHLAAIPGVWLMPALIVLVVLATQELLGLWVPNGLKPIVPVVHLGNLLVLLSPWVPVACALAGHAALSQPVSAQTPSWSCLAADGWSVGALALAIVLALLAEIARYEKPGRVTTDLAAAVFAMTYLGFLLSFAVRLRLTWGIGALASLVIVVKMGDTGAYFFGKAIGRHQMAPALSPSKTIEGAIGAILFSCLASWAVFRWLVPITTPQWVPSSGAIDPVWGSIVFGVVVGGAGILGDLAESLLKRDAARKDSSTWIPGLGGVLDMLDSIILAAPLAYACWCLGLTG
jgi:phosphatidate cytidylyltransferase